MLRSIERKYRDRVRILFTPLDLLQFPDSVFAQRNLNVNIRTKDWNLDKYYDSSSGLVFSENKKYVPVLISVLKILKFLFRFIFFFMVKKWHSVQVRFAAKQ